MISKFISIANILDKLKLFKEADYLDQVIKIANSDEEKSESDEQGGLIEESLKEYEHELYDSAVVNKLKRLYLLDDADSVNHADHFGLSIEETKENYTSAYKFYDFHRIHFYAIFEDFLKIPKGNISNLNFSKYSFKDPSKLLKRFMFSYNHGNSSIDKIIAEITYDPDFIRAFTLRLIINRYKVVLHSFKSSMGFTLSISKPRDTRSLDDWVDPDIASAKVNHFTKKEHDSLLDIIKKDPSIKGGVNVGHGCFKYSDCTFYFGNQDDSFGDVLNVLIKGLGSLDTPKGNYMEDHARF